MEHIKMMIRFLWAVILPPCCSINIFAGCTSRHSLLLYGPFFTAPSFISNPFHMEQHFLPTHDHSLRRHRTGSRLQSYRLRSHSLPESGWLCNCAVRFGRSHRQACRVGSRGSAPVAHLQGYFEILRYGRVGIPQLCGCPVR